MATENCVWSNLIALFPELTDADFAPQSGTIMLQNDSDGYGTYIAKWEHPTLEQPSDSDLKITRAPVVIDVIPEVIEEVIMMDNIEPMPEIPEDAMVTFVAATE
jgi:hypothetical protein